MLNTTSIVNNQCHEVNRYRGIEVLGYGGIDNATPPLCPKHCQELLEKRALDERWIQANCRSLTAQEATQRLGYSAKSAGILLEGVGIQIQFKPDRPWKNEGEKKAPKYRSPVGDYDAMLPIHPDEPTYWDDLEALKTKCYQVEGHPCLVITEGFFKAIAGCSNGIPTIGLLGVEMGLTSSKADVQGKRYLVERLEKFAHAQFGFIIAFDADAVTNYGVISAQLKLAQQLIKFKVPVYSATGLWSIEQGKGMDDYIQNDGAEQFKREILGKVPNIQAWERQFAREEDLPKRPPKAVAVAKELSQKYSERLAWHDKEQCWYCYESETPGIWSEESDITVGAVILAELEATLGLIFGSAYLADVLKLLKHKLLRKRWDERNDLIPLIDGVLRKDTLELLPHSPKYNLTWSLPIRWADRTVSCDIIQSWMLEIMKGDRALVEVLRALLNCVIFERANYQRYLEAIGPGGTGKGTFFRLATALIGDKNVFPTTLKNLEENRFEVAAAAKAKLIIVTEAEKYGGEVNVLKAITGQDKNRIEVKGRQQKCGDGFTFNGFVFVSANEPCQNADYTSGLERRRLSVPFSVQTLPEFRRDLNDEFQPYLAGLLEWVLTMPEAEVRSLIVNTNKSVPTLAKVRNEALCDTNPLADWLDNCIVLAPASKTYIGLDNADREETWLYANYTVFMRQTNGRPIGQRRYTKLLEDLCCNQLKLEGVKRGRDRYGSYFTGLKIRTDQDTALRPITGFEPPSPPDIPPPTGSPPVTESSSNCDGSVTAETLGSDGCDGCDAFFEVNESNENFVLDETPLEPPASSSETENLGESVNQGFNSITVAEPIEIATSQPSHPSITTHHNPSHPSQEIDYSTFPHLTSDTIEAKRNQALKIKLRLLEVTNCEVLSALQQEFSTRLEWTWKHLLTDAERNKITAVAQSEQLSLLAPGADVPAQVAQPLATAGKELAQVEPNSIESEEAIADLTGILQLCDSIEYLAALRQTEGFTPSVLNKACKRLSPEQHAQIKDWVKELNQRDEERD
jgi:putative DNA primase/helicase